MEPKFQTSFIPKKPLPTVGGGASASLVQKPPKQITSIYMVLAVVIFSISLLAVGGAFAWNKYLENDKAKLKEDLENLEKKFAVNKIEQLKMVDVQIQTAKMLLENHVAVSALFQMLSDITSENIRYLSLNLASSEITSEGIKITLSGKGLNLPALAFQSKVLASLEKFNLKKVIKNPILANPDVNDDGTVDFQLEAVIDPAGVSYGKSFLGESSSTSQ